MTNSGSGDCAASVTGLRLGTSSTSHPNTDPTLVASYPTPAISAHSSVAQSTTVTIPAGTAVGTYYIWVVADNVVTSTLGQTSVLDDYAASPALAVTVVAAQPNLQPQYVSLSSYTVQAGQSLTAYWTMTNSGNGNCAASVTGLRLGTSSSSHPNTDPTMVLSYPTPAISAHSSVAQSTTVTIPAGTAAGTYYVWVVADNVVTSTLGQTSVLDDYAASPALAVTVSSVTTVSIISPNTGTTWPAGISQNVTWTVSDLLSQINYYILDYSLDGGVTWYYDVAAAYPPSTSVSWAIPPNIASTQAIVRLKAFNSSAVQIAANVSPAFTISSSAGTPTSIPNCNNRSPSPASAVTITFNGTASTGSSPSCGIASYLWTFDDGSTGTGSTPSHTYYPSPGSVTTYNVYLQVTDSCGKVAVNSQPLTITITGQALGNSNPTQPTSKDPVNLATGNYTYNHVDLRIPGRGLPFEFKRFYNSKATASTGLPLGYGWTDSYNIGLSVSPSNNAVVIAFGDGHSEMYATNGAGGYFSQPGIYNVLTASGGNYTLTTKEQQKYNFNSSGLLTSIVDKNNNTISLAYTGNNLTTITNTVGRVISFAYNANNCLTNITDPLNRTVRFAYDANTNLISVTDTRGGLTQFGYDQYHQVTNAIDPRGNTFVSMQYDDEQRVVSSQKDALQGATTFTYDFVAGKTTVVDAMTNVSYYFYDPNCASTKSRMIWATSKTLHTTPTITGYR